MTQVCTQLGEPALKTSAARLLRVSFALILRKPNLVNSAWELLPAWCRQNSMRE